ncbi:hypothetical protein P4S72_18980 [Vibrio sp. PP-XX7]
MSQAIQTCVDSGVMFFTIAGNDNQRSYEFTYQDVDSATADTHPSSGDKIAYGNDFHQWPNGSAFLPITIPAGSHIRAVLNWNQPYISYQTNKVNFPLIDFDMFLFEKNTSTNQMNVLYSSLDSQEKIAITIPLSKYFTPMAVVKRKHCIWRSTTGPVARM